MLNGVVGKINFTQTSKGVWYCTDLEIIGEKAIQEADAKMTEIETMLIKHNVGKEEKETIVKKEKKEKNGNI